MNFFFFNKIQRSRLNRLDDILNKLSESVSEGLNSKDFQKIKDCIMNMVETMNNVSKTEIMVFLFKYIKILIEIFLAKCSK